MSNDSIITAGLPASSRLVRTFCTSGSVNCTCPDAIMEIDAESGHQEGKGRFIRFSMPNDGVTLFIGIEDGGDPAQQAVCVSSLVRILPDLLGQVITDMMAAQQRKKEN